MKLYSGGFSRFFLDDWQEESGNASSNDTSVDDDEATPDQVRRYFEAFKSELATAISENSPITLDWSEALDGPHYVVTLTEEEFGALLTIAARVAIADRRMTPISTSRKWHEDPAVIAVQDVDENYLPVHHLVKADSWLPADFGVIIETEVPERDLIFGSLAQMADALKAMHPILNTPNEATRKLSTQLVSDARTAHLALKQIVDWAKTHKMPILIEP